MITELQYRHDTLVLEGGRKKIPFSEVSFVLRPEMYSKPVEFRIRRYPATFRIRCSSYNPDITLESKQVLSTSYESLLDVTSCFCMVAAEFQPRLEDMHKLYNFLRDAF